MIIDALRQRGYDAKQSGTNFVLARCPFHQDKDASLSIKVDGRRARCFSPRCEAYYEPKDWLDIAEKISTNVGLVDAQSEGAEVLDCAVSRLRHLRDSYQRSLDREIDQLDGVEPPPSSQPWTDFYGPWRGLPAEYLIGRGARRWMDSGGLPDGRKIRVARLWLPVRHEPDGQLAGWLAETIDVKLRAKKTGVKPKCRNMPGMQAERVLFGLDSALKKSDFSGTIALVEGPFDQMWTDFHSIPCAALLGTGTWVNHPGEGLAAKAKLLVSAGIEHVTLMFDGDDAGRACASNVSENLSGWIRVSTVHLPEGSDPGELRAKDFDRIRKRYF